MNLSFAQTLALNSVYWGIDIFAWATMVVLACMCQSTFGKTQSMRYMRSMIVWNSIVLLAESASWLFQGSNLPYARAAIYTICYVYYIGVVAAIASFSRYAHYEIEGSDLPRNLKIPSMAVPLIAIFLLCFFNDFNGWMFYVHGNQLIRGPLSQAISVAFYLYFLVSMAFLLVRRRREKGYDKRREYLTFAGFIMLPAVFGALHFIFPWTWLIWPSVALSTVVLFVQRTHARISMDPLTGLNNRGMLDSYLNAHVFESENPACCLLLIDVDKFKSINDTYGHAEGDLALKYLANGMKEVFGSDHAFLARYGGDEFVVVFTGASNSYVDDKVAEFKSYFEQHDMPEEMSAPISVSVGKASMPNDEIKTVDELIRSADSKMYADKRSNS